MSLLLIDRALCYFISETTARQRPIYVLIVPVQDIGDSAIQAEGVKIQFPVTLTFLRVMTTAPWVVRPIGCPMREISPSMTGQSKLNHVRTAG